MERVKDVLFVLTQNFKKESNSKNIILFLMGLFIYFLLFLMFEVYSFVETSVKRVLFSSGAKLCEKEPSKNVN